MCVHRHIPHKIRKEDVTWMRHTECIYWSGRDTEDIIDISWSLRFHPAFNRLQYMPIFFTFHPCPTFPVPHSRKPCQHTLDESRDRDATRAYNICLTFEDQLQNKIPKDKNYTAAAPQRRRTAALSASCSFTIQQKRL